MWNCKWWISRCRKSFKRVGTNKTKCNMKNLILALTVVTITVCSCSQEEIVKTPEENINGRNIATYVPLYYDDMDSILTSYGYSEINPPVAFTPTFSDCDVNYYVKSGEQDVVLYGFPTELETEAAGNECSLTVYCNENEEVVGCDEPVAKECRVDVGLREIVVCKPGS